MEAMASAVVELVADFVEGLPDAPANGAARSDLDVDLDLDALLRPPAEEPGELAGLLAVVRDAAGAAVETAGPGYLAYVPGGGLYASALAEMLARALNRYSGFAAFAPALVALEEGVLRWLCAELGMPPGSGGLLTTGGSMATLTAVVAAREAHLGRDGDLRRGTLYLTEHTHSCVAKAAHVAGLRPDQIRVVPTTSDLRMDPDAAVAMVEEDRAAGRRPFMLVGTAGTTDTGTVDPLPALAEVARDLGLWFHVDGAYGGLFHLTERGRARLAGMERADSVVLDPHKTLFLSYGTGALLVRDPAALRRAFAADAHYLQDIVDRDTLPDYADLGPELTRDYRGLRVWLPLHLHGVGAFRRALDEKLDLARYAHDELQPVPELELPWEPDLSTVVLRLRPPAGADPATVERLDRELLARVNAPQRIHVSSTVVGGRTTVRLCLVSHRTHHDRIAEAVDIVRAAAAATLASA
jgi:glutamate/tyrosine decarboxylase-like PLP-dependent enzyme